MGSFLFQIHFSSRLNTASAFGFKRMFGPITFIVQIPREVVCERKVVGTREVPAREAYSEEIVEYVCPESFLVKLGEANE